MLPFYYYIRRLSLKLSKNSFEIERFMHLTKIIKFDNSTFWNVTLHLLELMTFKYFAMIMVVIRYSIFSHVLSDSNQSFL